MGENKSGLYNFILPGNGGFQLCVHVLATKIPIAQN